MTDNTRSNWNGQIANCKLQNRTTRVRTQFSICSFQFAICNSLFKFAAWHLLQATGALSHFTSPFAFEARWQPMHKS